MTELITRLEALTGPDREVDLHMMRYVENIGGDPAKALHYTASLDAAMTLVPEGCDKWAVSGRNAATVGKDRQPIRWSYAATPAIALCIAALKARNNHD